MLPHLQCPDEYPLASKQFQLFQHIYIYNYFIFLHLEVIINLLLSACGFGIHGKYYISKVRIIYLVV